MEYFHRMWGRAIGLTFAIPAAFFLIKKWVPQHVKPRLGIYAGIILFQVYSMYCIHLYISDFVCKEGYFCP